MTESRDKPTPGPEQGRQDALSPSPPTRSGRRPESSGRPSGTTVRLDSGRRRGGQLIVGRLTEHGRANYQFRAQEDVSYFVKILTTRGERVLWGKDLERAVLASETQAKVGDLVGARRIGRRAVTITARSRDAEGRIVAQDEHHAHRNTWVLEKVQFFAQRARLARQARDEQADVRESVRAHPELSSTFISFRAAEDYAARHYADPAERRRFIEGVRAAMSASIQKGEPLPSVRMRDRTQRTAPARTPSMPRKPEEPTR